MVIDFHTHIFPDKIAQKTIDYLAEKGGNKPWSNGTVEGLLSGMQRGGVDLSITLPVLTKPEQFESVLNYAIMINNEYKGNKVISFAGIHPKCVDIKEKLRAVKNAGIKGVKIHPDYQNTPIDDEGYIEILTTAKELDLIVVTHAGIDCAYRDKATMCSPEKLCKVIDTINHEKFVLAHYGSSELFDEVYTLLAGKNVYFDTAYILKMISKEQFNKILEKHGSDKVLFATDFPWSDMKGDLEIIRSFIDDKTVLEKVLYKNALNLLGM